MRIEASKGMSIYLAAQEAVRAARDFGAPVDLVFNGLAVIVSPMSFADDIATIYTLKAELRRNVQAEPRPSNHET